MSTRMARPCARAGVKRHIFIASTAATDSESFGLATARIVAGSGRPSVSTTNSTRTRPWMPEPRNDAGYSGAGQYTDLGAESTAAVVVIWGTLLVESTAGRGRAAGRAASRGGALPCAHATAPASEIAKRIRM